MERMEMSTTSLTRRNLNSSKMNDVGSCAM